MFVVQIGMYLFVLFFLVVGLIVRNWEWCFICSIDSSCFVFISEQRFAVCTQQQECFVVQTGIVLFVFCFLVIEILLEMLAIFLFFSYINIRIVIEMLVI